MFEASAVGIAVLDEQHHFAATNEALQKMVGYSGEELQSLGPLDITHQADREATQKLIEDMQNGKRQDLPTETRYRRKDSKVIWVRVSAAWALDSSSSLQGIPTIIEDIIGAQARGGSLARRPGCAVACHAANRHGRTLGVDRP
jgi:PAS domain S-box-containing protein